MVDDRYGQRDRPNDNYYIKVTEQEDVIVPIDRVIVTYNVETNKH